MYPPNPIVVAVESGSIGLGGGVYGGSGGETVGGVLVYRWDGDRDVRLIMWEDTVSSLILGTEHNALLAYSLGLELHHLVMSML